MDEHSKQGWRQDLPDRGAKFPDGGGAITRCPDQGIELARENFWGCFTIKKNENVSFIGNIWIFMEGNLKNLVF